MRILLCIALLWTVSCAAFAQNFADQQKHAAAALAALKAETAKEGHDCAQAHTQYEENMCVGEVVQSADKNLSVFYENLKAMLNEAGQENLQLSQDAWSEYRKKACEAVYAFYDGGTIRNSAEGRCEIKLARERMRDLDDLYEGPLHH